MQWAIVIEVIICRNIHLTVPALSFLVYYHHPTVNQAQNLAVQAFLLMILCGMVKTALVKTVVALSPTCMPWFYRQIPLTTSEDIETHICRDEASSNEDVLVREFQL